MVINSAQMQNAGKEFMLFQAVSMKQDATTNKDSFSAIFNNVTGNNLFQKVNSCNNNVFINQKQYTDAKLSEGPVKVMAESPKSIKAEKAELTDVNKAENSEVLQKAEVEAEVDEISEEDIEKAASLLVQVTVTVTLVLNVSMDELQQGMQELGFNPTDLLQSDNRYQLFVNMMAEGDATNLLKDNSLVDLLNTMENQIADLMATEGFSPATFEENFSQCVETVIQKTNEFLENIMTTTEQKPQNETKVDQDGKETLVVDGIETEKAPKVEVSSESQNDSTGKNNTESQKKEKLQPVKAEEVSNKFVNNLVNSFESKFSQVKVSEVQYIPDIREIVNQIMEQVKIHVNNANTSIEIQLTPEALGKVQVSVEDNNGVLTAKFQAETRVAKEAIESNLIQFKEHLAEQGIKVDSVEVSVGNFDFTGNQFGKNQGQEAESHVKKHFSLEDVSGTKTQTEDLKAAAYIDNGTSTVSFTA